MRYVSVSIWSMVYHVYLYRNMGVRAFSDFRWPTEIAQICQGVGFIGLAMWLIFANNSKAKGPSKRLHVYITKASFS